MVWMENKLGKAFHPTPDYVSKRSRMDSGTVDEVTEGGEALMGRIRHEKRSFSIIVYAAFFSRCHRFCGSVAMCKSVFFQTNNACRNQRKRILGSHFTKC